MDNLLGWLGLALGLFLAYFFLLQHKYRNYWEGIPFLTPIPFVGSMKFFELMKYTFHDLERIYYNKYGRIYGFLKGNSPVLTVADPELVRLITVKDSTTIFLNRKPFIVDEFSSHMLFATRDEKWKKIRNAITPTFSSGKMKRMVPLINECANSLIESIKDRIRDGLDFDVKSTISAFTMDVISSVAFATRVNSHKDPNNPVVVNARKLFNNKSLKYIIPLVVVFPKLMQFFNDLKLINVMDTSFFQKLTNKILEDRRKENLSEKEKRVDFLQLMIDAQKNFEKEQERISQEQNIDVKDPKDFEIVNKLTEIEMFAQCVTFFTVGFDTTASTITSALYMLGTQPKYQEKLYQEIQEALKISGGEITYDMLISMPFLEAVVCETFRMYPALPIVNREVGEDFLLGDTGIQLKKGMEVFIPLIGLHYDPEYYPEPFKFKPERFLPENKDSLTPFTYMPFGLGPRSCVAIRFAQMEAKVALVNLLRKFRFSRCPRTMDKIETQKGTFLFQPINVFLKVEERNPSSI